MIAPREESWTCYTIEAGEGVEEELAAALCSRGALGVEVEGGPGSPGAPVRLRVYFGGSPAPPGEEEIRAILDGEGAAGARLVGAEIVPDGRWAERYVASLKPFDVGGRFTVIPVLDADAPGALAPPPPGRLALRICPSRAFGTGEHPTTRLCLEAIEEEARPGLSVLDVGTGSGILAIAAALLGAGPVTAVDTDDEAIRVARLNAGLEPRAAGIRFEHGGAPASGSFGLVVANINGAVLETLGPHLAGLAARGGRLVLSGLLDAETGAILAALREAGARELRVRREGGWACLLCEVGDA